VSDDYHELVYQAAKEANSKDDLKKKLDKLAKAHPGFFIDEPKSTFYLLKMEVRPDLRWTRFTAASRLAYEVANSFKHSDAIKIDWLCQLGANAEEVAMSFALAGDEQRAKACQEAYNVDPASLVYALIFGQGINKSVLAQEYIFTYEVSPFVIASALAARGEIEDLQDYYDDLLTKQPKINLPELIQTICINAARYGHESIICRFRTFYPGNQKDLESFMVPGRAMAERPGIMENFLKLVGRKISEMEYNLVIHAVKSYIAVGLHDKVKTLCQQLKLNPEIIAKAYIEHGNKGRAKEYSIQELLNSYYDERKAILDKNNQPKQYKGLPIPFFQKSFDEKTAAITALVKVLNGEAPANFDLRQHLSTLRDGNLGKALRKFVKEGMADHFVGEEVRTVTAFITALEKKIPKSGLTH
jgi:hypothetical protein